MVPSSSSSSSSSLSATPRRHRSSISVQQRSSRADSPSNLPSSSSSPTPPPPPPPPPLSSNSFPQDIHPQTPSTSSSAHSSSSNTNTTTSGYTSTDEDDEEEQRRGGTGGIEGPSSRLVLEPPDSAFDSLTFDLESEGDQEDDEEADIEDPNAPFIPINHTRRSSRHDKRSKRPSSSSLSSSHPSSGPLTLFHLTLNLVNTSLSPTILALPYAVNLLSPSLFIPLTVILGFLAAASHVSIVYIARYLGVKRYEDLGKGLGGGKVFRGVLRVMMLLAGIGILVLYLRMMGNLMIPVADTFFVHAASIVHHRSFWVVIFALMNFPLLLPFHLHSSTITRISFFASLLTIFVSVVTIVKTIALHRNEIPTSPPSVVAGTDFGAIVAGDGLGRGGIWGGITIITFTLTSHLSTLPNHATLLKSSQRSFAISPLLQNLATLALLLPLSLLPYFLLSPSTHLSSSSSSTTIPFSSGGSTPHSHPSSSAMLPPMILDAFPTTDPWIVSARLAAIGMALAGTPMVFLPTRDVLARTLKSWLDVKGGGLEPAGQGGRRGKEFWVATSVLWGFVTGLAVLNDYWVAEKVVLMGVAGALALSFVLPAILFIILFHLRRPLSIIFPSSSNNTNTSPSTSQNPFTPSPSQVMDALLAKKERQLQKRRTGRRIWQDGVIFFGVLPTGLVVTVWSFGRLFAFGGRAAVGV